MKSTKPIWRILIGKRDCGEGPFATRQAARDFLRAEVGAKGAKVVRCTK